MILLISHPHDEHARRVLEVLRRRGADGLLFDTARFPRGIGLTVHSTDGAGWQAEATVDGTRHDLADVRVVWWRRPLPYELHDEVAGAEDRAFAYGECHHAVTGLWSSLDAFWINDPEHDEVASRKMYQLKLASHLGLRTPRTCVTNEPHAAAQFAAGEGDEGTIYKSFAATERAWRETRLLRPEERELFDNVRFAPVIFQERIPAVADVRVTIVGDQVFPAQIRTSASGYQYDFRMTMDHAEMRPHELPQEIEKRLLELMTTLGIVYGAVDLRLTPEGDYVFLEVNPAGQWLFIEVQTGQPITEALCDLIVGADG